jgi:hypothetical protein
VLTGVARASAPAVAAALAWTYAASALAHVGHVIQRAERYLKLDASERDTRLVVSLTLGDLEGERVLRDADADGDRRVSEVEAEAYLHRWAEGLRSEIPVWIDGTPVETVWTDGWFDPLGSVRRTAVTLELVTHLPVDAREHRIVFEDRMVRREIFDRTDVAFRAHDGARLEACGTGDSPERCDAADIAFVRGGPLPRRFAVRVVYPHRRQQVSWVLLGTAGVVAAILVACVRMLGGRTGRRDTVIPSRERGSRT